MGGKFKYYIIGQLINFSVNTIFYYTYYCYVSRRNLFTYYFKIILSKRKYILPV